MDLGVGGNTVGGVQFEEEQSLAPRAVNTSRGGLSVWLVTKGVAKNERQANYMLLGVALVTFVLAYLFYWLASPHQGTLSPIDQHTIQLIHESLQSHSTK